MNTIQPEKLVVYRHNENWFAIPYNDIGLKNKELFLKTKGRSQVFKKLTDMDYEPTGYALESYTIFTLVNNPTGRKEKNSGESEKKSEHKNSRQPQLL